MLHVCLWQFCGVPAWGVIGWQRDSDRLAAIRALCSIILPVTVSF